MEQVSEQICAERRKVSDERFMRDKERIEYLEVFAERLTKVSLQNSELIKNQAQQLSAHDSRINRIENKPDKYIDMIKTAVVAAVISGAVSYLISLI